MSIRKVGAQPQRLAKTQRDARIEVAQLVYDEAVAKLRRAVARQIYLEIYEAAFEWFDAERELAKAMAS